MQSFIQEIEMKVKVMMCEQTNKIINRIVMFDWTYKQWKILNKQNTSKKRITRYKLSNNEQKRLKQNNKEIARLKKQMYNGKYNYMHQKVVRRYKKKSKYLYHRW